MRVSALGQKFAVQKAMSALPPQADMCGANGNVCFGPKADMPIYSITSSARARTDAGTVRALAHVPERKLRSTERHALRLTGKYVTQALP
jgi:hypothetical protein